MNFKFTYIYTLEEINMWFLLYFPFYCSMLLTYLLGYLKSTIIQKVLNTPQILQRSIDAIIQRRQQHFQSRYFIRNHIFDFLAFPHVILNNFSHGESEIIDFSCSTGVVDLTCHSVQLVSKRIQIFFGNRCRCFQSVGCQINRSRTW